MLSKQIGEARQLVTHASLSKQIGEARRLVTYTPTLDEVEYKKNPILMTDSIYQPIPPKRMCPALKKAVNEHLINLIHRRKRHNISKRRSLQR